MELRRLVEDVAAISDRYAEFYGIERDDAWYLLKVQEEVGELTQAYLMRSGQARAKGRSAEELELTDRATMAGTLHRGRRWEVTGMQRTPVELATDLDRLAGVPRRVDPTVQEALRRARAVPLGSTRDVAEKLARHAVLLRHFGEHLAAQEAAGMAVRLFESLDRAEVDAQVRGYAAYARMVCAITWFYADEYGRAHVAALEAVEVFKAHLALLSPVNIFDLVQLLIVLAQTHRQRGEMQQGGQAIVDAKVLADELKALPWGPPGTVPPQLWGLPVNPSENERRIVFGT